MSVDAGSGSGEGSSFGESPARSVPADEGAQLLPLSGDAEDSADAASALQAAESAPPPPSFAADADAGAVDKGGPLRPPAAPASDAVNDAAAFALAIAPLLRSASLTEADIAEIDLTEASKEVDMEAAMPAAVEAVAKVAEAPEAKAVAVQAAAKAEAKATAEAKSEAKAAQEAVWSFEERFGRTELCVG
jgi:hypothetical protein